MTKAAKEARRAAIARIEDAMRQAREAALKAVDDLWNSDIGKDPTNGDLISTYAFVWMHMHVDDRTLPNLMRAARIPCSRYSTGIYQIGDFRTGIVRGMTAIEKETAHHAAAAKLDELLPEAKFYVCSMAD